jgi:hypothetical protein
MSAKNIPARALSDLESCRVTSGFHDTQIGESKVNGLRRVRESANAALVKGLNRALLGCIALTRIGRIRNAGRVCVCDGGR